MSYDAVATSGIAGSLKKAALGAAAVVGVMALSLIAAAALASVAVVGLVVYLVVKWTGPRPRGAGPRTLEARETPTGWEIEPASAGRT